MAQSTIKDEVIGLWEALEMAVFLCEIWMEVSGKNVLIVGKTDSRTLERAIGSTNGISNRRLRIDLPAIKEALELGEMNGVDEVKRIASKRQVAGGLTKLGR